MSITNPFRRAAMTPSDEAVERTSCPTCGATTMRGTRGVNEDFKVCADPCHGPVPEPYASEERTFGPSGEQPGGEELDTWLARALWEFNRQSLPGKGRGMEPPWPDRESGQCSRYYAQAERIIAKLGPPSGEYQRAVSDMVEALEREAKRESRGWREWITPRASIDRFNWLMYAADIVREFASTSKENG